MENKLEELIKLLESNSEVVLLFILTGQITTHLILRTDKHPQNGTLQILFHLEPYTLQNIPLLYLM